MSPMKISRQRLALLKTALRNISPAVRSSHADEALAFAMGFGTHASLLAALDKVEGRELDVPFEPDQLVKRLETLGYAFAPGLFNPFSALIGEAFMEQAMALLRDAASRAANDNGPAG